MLGNSGYPYDAVERKWIAQYASLHDLILMFGHSNQCRQAGDCATSFLEIYVQLYDFEKNCGQMNKAGLKFVIQTEKPIIMIPLM